MGDMAISKATSSGAGLQPLARSAQPPAAAGPAKAAPRDAVLKPISRSQVPARGVSLDLLTYNVWGLPAPIGKRLKDRMDQIGPAIKGHGIVGLQEAFNRHAKSIQTDGGYAVSQRGGNGGPFKLNSGLETLSQYPIIATEFSSFKLTGHADQFAGKGVLFTRFDVPGIGPVDVYNTHYQAEDGDKYELMRMHDNDVLGALIRKNDKGNPTFIMGDFNSVVDSDSYRDRMKQFPGMIDLFTTARPQDAGATSSGENTNNKPGKTPIRLDYIFYLPSPRFDIKVESAEVSMKTPGADGKHLSDHFGLQSRVRLTPKAPAPTQHPTAVRGTRVPTATH